MNAYKPVQQASGLYLYCVQTADGVRATGNCAGDCPGHESAAGACLHQRDFWLERYFQVIEPPEHVVMRGFAHCAVCKNPTQIKALVGPLTIWLCAKHGNPEDARAYLKVSEHTSALAYE